MTCIGYGGPVEDASKGVVLPPKEKVQCRASIKSTSHQATNYIVNYALTSCLLTGLSWNRWHCIKGAEVLLFGAKLRISGTSTSCAGAAFSMTFF